MRVILFAHPDLQPRLSLCRLFDYNPLSIIMSGRLCGNLLPLQLFSTNAAAHDLSIRSFRLTSGSNHMLRNRFPRHMACSLQDNLFGIQLDLGFRILEHLPAAFTAPVGLISVCLALRQLLRNLCKYMLMLDFRDFPFLPVILVPLADPCLQAGLLLGCLLFHCPRAPVVSQDSHRLVVPAHLRMASGTVHHLIIGSGIRTGSLLLIFLYSRGRCVTMRRRDADRPASDRRVVGAPALIDRIHIHRLISRLSGIDNEFKPMIASGMIHIIHIRPALVRMTSHMALNPCGSRRTSDIDMNLQCIARHIPVKGPAPD